MSKIKKFIESVNLLDVFLTSENCVCLIHPRAIEPSEICLSFDFEAGAETIEENNNIIIVTASLKVSANNNKTEDIHFEAYSEFALTYELKEYKETITEKLLDEFARTTGMFNAYPYLREAIQSMTTKMGIPPVVAPLLKIEPPKVKPENQPKSNSSSKKKKTRKK